MITEYGFLSTKADLYTPEQMVNVMRQFETAFQARPEVKAWAWFSTYYVNPVYRELEASNLLHADGSLTPLGWAWRDIAAQPLPPSCCSPGSSRYQWPSRVIPISEMTANIETAGVSLAPLSGHGERFNIITPLGCIMCYN